MYITAIYCGFLIYNCNHNYFYIIIVVAHIVQKLWRRCCMTSRAHTHTPKKSVQKNNRYQLRSLAQRDKCPNSNRYLLGQFVLMATPVLCPGYHECIPVLTGFILYLLLLHMLYYYFSVFVFTPSSHFIHVLV